MKSGQLQVVAVVLAVLVALALTGCLSTNTQTKDFFELVTAGTPQDVQAAISKGADVNARDKDDMTPLMCAAETNKNPEVITILLKAGADIKAQDLHYSQTPLMWAAWDNPNPEVITTLLKAGADIEARDKDGSTPLMIAARISPNPEVIAMLLKAGADAKAKNKAGQTVLDCAKYNENLKGTAALKQLEEASK
jgi:ankyrin repeat protein